MRDGFRALRQAAAAVLFSSLACLVMAAPDAPAGKVVEETGNDLSYESFIDSASRFKCLYGYVAEKTGNHAAAIRIFDDCVRRWNDVYSMIWLAQIYETGIGVPRDLVRATALVKRGAESNDAAGYSSLARYHYGVALHEGRGVARDEAQARVWLERAAREGVVEAADYLSRLGLH